MSIAKAIKEAAIIKVNPVNTANESTIAQSLQDSLGFPLYDIGEYFSYRGIPVRKVSNGVSSRYTPGSFRLNAEIPQPNVTDSSVVGTVQYLGQLTIPGGTLVGKTQALLNATFACPSQWGTSSGQLNIDILTSDGTILQFYVGTTAPTATSQSFTNVALRGTDSSTLTVSGGGINPWSGTANKRCNLLKDIVVRFGFKAASGFGRAVSLTSATLDILDSATVAQSSMTYRNPVQQPFKTSSFWNTPLGNGATFQTATDLETANILTADPGGVGWAAYPFVGGYNGGGNNFVQLSSNDPICNFTYQSRCNEAPWPFATTAASGSFKMRAPAHEFITAQSTDRVITLITPDKRYIIESGSYSYNPSTNTHVLGYCTVWDLYGTGITNSINTSVLPLLSEGYRGSGHPICGGIIRKSEMENLQINHVLAMQLSNYQQRAAVFAVVGSPAGGNTFSIKPVDTAQTAQSYTSMFKSGGTVYYNNTAYTLSADSTYDSASNTTNFTVSTTIAGSSNRLYLGGTDTNSQKKTQYVWPATNVDGNSLSPGHPSFYRGLVPMGAMFGIPSNVDLNTLGITTPEGMAVARAFQQYGGVNNDTTIGTFMLCSAESRVSVAQINNLYADRVAIRNALRMITNVSSTNPGGPGTRVTNWPAELQPMY